MRERLTFNCDGHSVVVLRGGLSDAELVERGLLSAVGQPLKIFQLLEKPSGEPGFDVVLTTEPTKYFPVQCRTPIELVSVEQLEYSHDTSSKF